MSSEASIVAGIASRYTSALFDLAAEAERDAGLARDLGVAGGALDQVAADLEVLRLVIDQSPDFRRMMTSPVITREDQARAVAAIAAKAQLSGLTRNFLGLLAKNRRLFVLPRIIEAYVALLADLRGEVRAEVASARALSDAQRAALVEQLRGALGKEVSVAERVDESLLGGLVVKVGSRMIDSSLKTKLANLKLALKEA